MSLFMALKRVLMGSFLLSIYFVMFWRRSRTKQEVEETDDLEKLQKQFGITPVNDADVQTEFQALLAATGATGSSPTEESLLFGTGDDEEDEEAKILRDLQLDGFNLDGDESGSHQEAENELRGVLDEVHQTARENHSREVAEMSGKTPVKMPKDGEKAAQVHALKMEALALKREGKIQEALIKFREAKQLQEQTLTQRNGDNDSVLTTVQNKETQSGRALMGTVLDDDDQDVEVTDEDMQDPEFLAQLAKMGLTENDDDSNGAEAVQYRNVMHQLSALETKIHECKVQAVQLKRQNQIAEALACMRKMKELEAKRDELQSSPTSKQTLAVQQVKQPEVAESVYRPTAVSTPDSVHLNSGAVPFDEGLQDSDNESILEVEVTPEDMDDPAFASELLKLGDDDEPYPTDIPAVATTKTESSPALPKRSLPDSRSLKTAPSIDEDYLIDAFDDKSDSEGESNHLTSVMSCGSLHSASSVPEVEKATIPDMTVMVKTESYRYDDLAAQLQKARQTALSLKRKGDIQNALASMRRAKQIQNLIDLKQQATEVPTTTLGSVDNSVRAAKYQEIEQLLVDFGNQAMTLAKDNISVNRKNASEWLTKRKQYVTDLEKLRQMRQNPLQLPPPYEIVKTSRQLEFELPFIPDDQIKVSVKSVNGLSQVAGKSVFVKFCLNFPSTTPHEGQTAEFTINSNASFATEVPSNQTNFIFKLARSRGTMRLFEIKKAIFEVWKPGTLFRNPELVARAYQELTPMLTCCEINTHIPFLGSNRKPCGGDIEIALQLHRPLKEKEIRLESVEYLVIGDYPAPMTSTSERTPTSNVVLESSPPDTHSPARNQVLQTPNNSSTIVKEDNSASTTADDPHHVDLIISYDVINEELEKVGAKLPSLTGPTAIEWRDRYDSLALKKQLLEIEMQTGNLTLDMYVERLHKRIAEDRVLISQLLESNRRLDAARVLHRVKIMEKELVGTEGSTAEA